MNPTLREQVARALMLHDGDTEPRRSFSDLYHERVADAALEAIRTYLLSDEVVERAAAGIADSEIAMYGWSEDEKPARTRLWVDEARAALQAALGEDQ